MKLLFKTRMALTMGTLTGVAVLAMTALMLTLSLTIVTLHYNRRGVLMTKLVTESVEHGTGASDRIVGYVGEQLRVAALLTAELAKVSTDADTLTKQLKYVSTEAHSSDGYPLLEDILVLDPMGGVYAYTGKQAPPPLIAAPEEIKGKQRSFFAQEKSESSAPTQTRTAAMASTAEVGYIAQVDMGEEVQNRIRKSFSLQHLLNQFVSPAKSAVDPFDPEREEMDLRRMGTGISRIVIIDAMGDFLAEVSIPGMEMDTLERQAISSFCMQLLQHPEPGVAVERFGEDLGVVTLLKPKGKEGAHALFIQHRIEPYFDVIQRQVKFIGGIGLILILIAVAVCFWLARRLSYPLTQLMEGARCLGMGDWHHRVSLTKADKEFQSLADSFNDMANALNHNVKELQIATQHRERLESELRIAAEQQQSLLPAQLPCLSGMQVAGFSRAAREVGGDFYDYMQMANGNWAIAVGDATNKGLPAAMLVTECWTVLTALAGETDSPAELLQRTNKALCRRVGDSGRFVTLFLVMIDTKQECFCYASAGHNPPFLVGHDGKRVARLTSDTGLPLGVLQDCVYKDVALPYQPEDTLLLYSDGVTEALDNSNALYGEERLLSFLKTARQCALSELLQRLEEDVAAFTQQDTLADDMTRGSRANCIVRHELVIRPITLKRSSDRKQ